MKSRLVDLVVADHYKRGMPVSSCPEEAARQETWLKVTQGEGGSRRTFAEWVLGMGTVVEELLGARAFDGRIVVRRIGSVDGVGHGL